MKIKVTPKHIAKGQKMRGEAWLSPNQAERECPVAQALREKYPNVRVSELSVVLDGNPKGEFVWLPEDVQAFVKRFDETGFGVAFEFELPETA